MIDDVFVGFEDAVREPIFAHEVPEIFDRVQLGRLRRQWQDGDVAGDDQVVGHVPASLIHDQDGVGILVDMTGDFGQMLRHGVGVTPRHHQRRRLAELRADCAENIGRSRTLIVGR